MSKKDPKHKKNCCEHHEHDHDHCHCECNEQNNDSRCECDDGKEVEILKDQLMRMQAELINYRRRKEDETARLMKYQGEDFIKALLPIVDDFERAIKLDDNDLTDELSQFLSGFKMVYGNLENILLENEIKSMDCLHHAFDPNRHQAVLTDKDENYESGIITDVLTKGYIYKDKVIRPAMVKVNE